MAGIELAPGLRLVTRAQWGADARLPRLGHSVARSARTHVFIHHTVMIDRDPTPNIWERDAEIFAMMRSLQRARPDLGLDVPYSFVAFLTAGEGLTIAEGRGEDRSGAHSVGHNSAAIGIAFAGDFHGADIDAAEIAARMPLLSAFLGWLRSSASHPAYGSFAPMARLGSVRPPAATGRAVWAHCDIKATACPGAKLLPHLAAVTFGGEA
ncbi:N-acetylmuramoyl-L-alanine amidase [Sphingomonas canadensis]|uniref:N-acetylmuramoyl-L-alanine amidase n=1 Tax=Sphingomonas canadensis TaxID=1219257 RepID=A0ABW3HBC7_9SPHN|nr:N-acetylmuramoyl-L-alanine amidase [Sphingomonas canadensis]MCW3837793.1 N-acetylmuramoyl-L-alanine amidase [Sphingomonas canadensis]